MVGKQRLVVAIAISALLAVASTATPAFARSGASPAIRKPDARFLGVVRSRTHAASAARSAATPPLTYHHGPVQHSSRVYPIFWIPPSYSLPAGYQTLVTQYFNDVAHDSFKTSNVYASDTQYFDVAGGAKRFLSYSTSVRPAIVDNHALPADGCANYLLDDGSTSTNCITDAQIEDEIQSVIADRGLPSGLGIEYFLFTPQGLASCFDATALASGGCYDPFSFDGFCAYHSSTDFSPSAVLYANMPFAQLAGCSSDESPNGNAADSVLNVTSHEHNETMTDPLGSGWFDSGGMENGDKCAFTFGAALGSTATGQYNQVINGHRYWLQLEWSNRKAGCVARNAFPQPTASFTFSPTAPGPGTKVKFSSTAHDVDDTVLTYRWTFPDGAVSTLRSPAHAFSTPGAKQVALVVFDAHGDQVRVTHTVNVG